MGISIHALREEGDVSNAPPFPVNLYFYPRPPRGGRRNLFSHDIIQFLFLSTPSARRATRYLDFFGTISKISIHALREEGDPAPGFAPLKPAISIHALREEGDKYRSRDKRGFGTFLSTPSARRATVTIDGAAEIQSISIHALREEGDAVCAVRTVIVDKISIHALREEGDPW